MGGRRGKVIREVYGTGNRQRKAELTRAINSEDVQQMTLSSFSLFFESQKVRSDFSKAVKLMSAIAKKSSEIGPLSKDESEKVASDIWTEIKSRNKFDVSKEFDKSIVTSASRVLRRKRE